ncbi:MAG: type II/IV secretion system ATPase subunit [Methanosarcinaceae archaeon]|nr:type II/IV secretion system ATPase subunit [Methanosarcinaceae archaeon]
MVEKTMSTHTFDDTCEPKRGILDRLRFWSNRPRSIPKYDPEIHGSLVESDVPDGYTEIERYWVDEPYAYVSIVEKGSVQSYRLVEPVLSMFDKEILERVHDDLQSTLSLSDISCDLDREPILMGKVVDLIDQYRIPLDDCSRYKILYYLKRNLLGYGRINGIMHDPYLEDISCDGYDVSIYLYHMKYLNIRTNIFYNEEKLNAFVISLCQRSGKHISIGEPLVDATLPNGSRLQATLGKAITTRGSSFNIRKFRSDPITPIDLIEFNTSSLGMIAYFWLAMENGFSAIFAGGTASGKTSMLNAVSLFIPPLSKVVSIEDTRELMLHHDNWIAGVTRESITETGTGSVSMFDLLRSALRQRPEYILVGEVRGKEALTLFQALSTGHTTYSTMHAGDVQTVVNRLENDPINVPRVMLQALDILCIQKQVFVDGKKVRRTESLVEFMGIDPRSGEIKINELYRWDPINDEFTDYGNSDVIQRIMKKRGWKKKELQEEMNTRERILEYLHRKGMRDYVTISLVMNLYSINPDIIVDAIENKTLEDIVQQNM